jgi:hypothetical protein
MDFREKAFASVQEVTKLLITLSTGLIAFTVAFSKDFMKAQLGSCIDKALWSAATILLVFSVACGIWTQLGVTTVLAPPTGSAGKPQISESEQTIRHKKIKMAFALQLLLFGTGVLLMGFYQMIKIWTL